MSPPTLRMDGEDVLHSIITETRIPLQGSEESMPLLATCTSNYRCSWVEGNGSTKGAKMNQGTGVFEKKSVLGPKEGGLFFFLNKY